MNRLPTPMFQASVNIRGTQMRTSFRLRTRSATSIATRPTCEVAFRNQRPTRRGSASTSVAMIRADLVADGRRGRHCRTPLIFTPHAP